MGLLKPEPYIWRIRVGIPLKTIRTDTATLDVIEFDKFDCKRVFTVRDAVVDEIRGRHAHYNGTQIIHCVNGMLGVTLRGKCFPDGYEPLMVYPGGYVIVYPMIWVEYYVAKQDTVFNVYCNTYYDEKDYIRDLGNFLMLQQNY